MFAQTLVWAARAENISLAWLGLVAAKLAGLGWLLGWLGSHGSRLTGIFEFVIPRQLWRAAPPIFYLLRSCAQRRHFCLNYLRRCGAQRRRFSILLYY